MIAAILAFSLRQRLLVVATACLLAVGGVYAYRALPIDAFPDVTATAAHCTGQLTGTTG